MSPLIGEAPRFLHAAAAPLLEDPSTHGHVPTCDLPSVDRQKCRISLRLITTGATCEPRQTGIRQLNLLEEAATASARRDRGLSGTDADLSDSPAAGSSAATFR